MSEVTPEEDEFVQIGFRFALSLSNNRHEAEDLVQQACLKVIAKKGRLSSRSYLLTSIRNLFYDKVRRNKLIAFEPLDNMETTLPASSSFALGRKLDLESSLNRLTAEEREVIYLNCVEGYSAAELAPILGKPRSTILNIISRAKARLLEDEEKEQHQQGGPHGARR